MLSGCEGSASPDRKQIEAIAKRNPLDMADEDSKTVVVGNKNARPPKPAKVQKIDAREAQYVAGKNSKIYHCRNCEYAGKLDSPVGFMSVEDAERSGHIPCEFCRPREFEAQASLPSPDSKR